MLALAHLTGSPTIASAAAEPGSTLLPAGYLGTRAGEAIALEGCSKHGEQACQIRAATPVTGGFGYPIGVATNAIRGIYITDVLDERIQRRDAGGAFSVIGANVNVSTDARPHAGPAKRDFCEPLRQECEPGKMGTAPGDLDGPESVAVEPSSGAIFVLELGSDDYRIDKLTATGGFVWRLGLHVNLTTGGNLCTEREVRDYHVRCGPGDENSVNGDEAGAFKFANQSGNLLAFDARRKLLYVGDEHRVQVFDPNGHWRYEIPLVSISAAPHSSTVALGLSPSGELDLVYRVGPVENYLPSERSNIIRRFGVHGQGARPLMVSPSSPGRIVSIEGMAVGPAGQIGAMGLEIGEASSRRFALLYWPEEHETIELEPPDDNDGIAFDTAGDLYVATAVDKRVQIYSPRNLAGPLSVSLACVGGSIVDADLSEDCPRVGVRLSEGAV